MSVSDVLALEPAPIRARDEAVPGPPIDREVAERTADLLRVLGDATRLRILSLAAAGDCTDATELAQRLGEPLTTVTAHVKALVAAGGLDVCHVNETPSYCVTRVAIAQLVRPPR
ncbi:helix-turn-helix domain-containing protein [Nonomuraea sp. NPDC003709]|uniref:helix-turn-helix domain-containing protein n=1 Tax=Nonomuraea sp. NPDC003709 TaxID=3154450 RepID=UPI0033B61929